VQLDVVRADAPLVAVAGGDVRDREGDLGVLDGEVTDGAALDEGEQEVPVLALTTLGADATGRRTGPDLQREGAVSRDDLRVLREAHGVAEGVVQDALAGRHRE